MPMNLTMNSGTLIEKGLWEVVENGVQPDPSKILELSGAEEFSRWRAIAAKDMKAIQILRSSLTDSAFRKTLSASSAKEVWDLLWKGNEEAKVRRLEKQFEELHKGDNESDDSYFDRVNGNVLFVPGIKENVLSLSQMESRGYLISEGEECERIIRDRTGAEFGETIKKKTRFCV